MLAAEAAPVSIIRTGCSKTWAFRQLHQCPSTGVHMHKKSLLEIDVVSWVVEEALVKHKRAPVHHEHQA